MRPEVINYQPELELLVTFAEGRLEGLALEAALASERMQTLLAVFAEAQYPAATNHWSRLQGQDRVSLGGLVNSEGIIGQFLQKAEVPFKSAQRFGNLYSLILSALPSYLDPPLEYLTEKIIPNDPALSAARQTKLIKERLKEHFKFTDKPPKWIQNPDWPIRNGTPLIFIGQVPVQAPELFHDTGAAYVFFDPAGGSFETVAQFH